MELDECKRCKITLPLTKFGPLAGERFARKKAAFDHLCNQLEHETDPDARSSIIQAIQELRVYSCIDCRCKPLNDTPRNNRYQECQEFYNHLKSVTPCSDCGCIDEVAMIFTRLNANGPTLSNIQAWAKEALGRAAMEAASSTFVAYCSFCAKIRRRRAFFDTNPMNEVDAIIDQLKLNEVCCSECTRITTLENVGGFEWAHLSAVEKTTDFFTIARQYRDGSIDIDQAISLMEKEWIKCRLLCANCHKRETDTRNKR